MAGVSAAEEDDGRLEGLLNLLLFVVMDLVVISLRRISLLIRVRLVGEKILLFSISNFINI